MTGDIKTKVALIIEYDGTRFLGSQCQPKAATVQSEVESAIEKLTGEKLRVMLSSRTDTGVSALGQVASFRTGSSLAPERIIGGLNHYLPQDIAIKAAYRIPDDLEVRRAAVSREYLYRIWNEPERSPLNERFRHRVAPRLDERAMDAAAKLLVGTHDLKAFGSAGRGPERSTVRTVYDANVSRNGAEVTFRIVASSFLTHQVRNTVGALIKVGAGNLTVEEFKGLLSINAPGKAGPAAPGKGLCLIKINYRKDLGDYNENT
ncbi:tRNA pseudouridine(38-40) synthase TruA [Dehalogenimonas sp. 4OHTPN]|uniref:tRNA pseudouridine synthase A n=1 Tax=Dehalogenimonas sp. 4OHTPN TaxID=3166643 RepID=A0AAU8GCA8_9CHLR